MLKPNKSLERDRALNGAIFDSDLSEGIEAVLELVHTYYAENARITLDSAEPIVGHSEIRGALFRFLAPLRMMAEIGGLAVSVDESRIPTDIENLTSSQWTLRLQSASGAANAISWTSTRAWENGKIVSERHSDPQRSGSPFSIIDFQTSSQLASQTTIQ